MYLINVVLSIAIFLVLILIISTLFIDLINFLYDRAPYLPSTSKDIENILKIHPLKSSDKVVDLGSGDAKILIKLAQAGISSQGYELNPLLVQISRLRIRLLGFTDKISIKQENFLNADFSKFYVFIIYGIKGVMPKVENKIIHEAEKGAIVISNKFRFNNLKHIKSLDNIHLYRN